MRHVGPALSIAASLALVCCSHTGKAPSASQLTAKPAARTTAVSPVPQRPQPSAPPATAPVRAATQPPAATATPSPLATAGIEPTPGRSTQLAPPPKQVTRLPADAAPEILDVAVSETTVKPGDRVFGRIVTSSNVASVEARIGGYAVSLAKVGVGRFELAYTVNSLPWFVHGNFTLRLIARNTRGDTVTREIPLTVR